MSLENLYSNNVKRKKTELIKLRNDRAKYTKDLSDASQKILRAERQLKNTRSSSTMNSKINEINRESKKKSEAEKRISECDAKIAKKEKELDKEETKLLKEQAKIQKNRDIEINSNYTQLKTDINLQKNSTAQLYEEIKKINNGTIIAVSSNLTERVNANTASYIASKAALEVITKQLAYELGQYNTNCNSISPGVFFSKMSSNISTEKMEEIKRNTPLNRIIDETEIKDVILTMLEDKMSWITGQNIIADGGNTIGF